MLLALGSLTNEGASVISSSTNVKTNIQRIIEE